MVGTLKLTASLHLKMYGWKMIVSFWEGLVSGAFAVSFREGICLICKFGTDCITLVPETEVFIPFEDVVFVC